MTDEQQPTREQVLADLQELDDTALKQALLAGQQATGQSGRAADGPPTEYNQSWFPKATNSAASKQARDARGGGGSYA